MQQTLIGTLCAYTSDCKAKVKETRRDGLERTDTRFLIYSTKQKKNITQVNNNRSLSCYSIYGTVIYTYLCVATTERQ